MVSDMTLTQRRDRRACLTVIIRCDSGPSTLSNGRTRCRGRALRYHWAFTEAPMNRPVLIALAGFSLASCSQGGDSAAPAAPSPPVSTAAEKAAFLAAMPAPYAQADLDNGRRVFARCRSCHTITEGGANMTGPNLHAVFGRKAGSKTGYNYSNALKQSDFGWDPQAIDHWLQNPRTFLPGNKMSFPGIPDAEDRRDVIAFLMVETRSTSPAE
jgi:cytochrome c